MFFIGKTTFLLVKTRKTSYFFDFIKKNRFLLPFLDKSVLAATLNSKIIHYLSQKVKWKTVEFTIQFLLNTSKEGNFLAGRTFKKMHSAKCSKLNARDNNCL